MSVSTFSGDEVNRAGRRAYVTCTFEVSDENIGFDLCPLCLPPRPLAMHPFLLLSAAAGIPHLLQVRVQLFQGSPKPVTQGGKECVLFKTTVDDSGRRGGDGGGEREVWQSGCVQDPTSPLYRRCATRVDRQYRPTRTGYCAEPTETMKVQNESWFCVLCWLVPGQCPSEPKECRAKVRIVIPLAKSQDVEAIV